MVVKKETHTVTVPTWSYRFTRRGVTLPIPLPDTNNNTMSGFLLLPIPIPKVLKCGRGDVAILILRKIADKCC